MIADKEIVIKNGEDIYGIVVWLRAVLWNVKDAEELPVKVKIEIKKCLPNY